MANLTVWPPDDSSIFTQFLSGVVITEFRAELTGFSIILLPIETPGILWTFFGNILLVGSFSSVSWNYGICFFERDEISDLYGGSIDLSDLKTGT